MADDLSDSDPVLVMMRQICLALPETIETWTWGSPHFRVGKKIFAGYGVEKGQKTIGFKLSMGDAAAIVEDPRFWPAAYVGHHRWVSTDPTTLNDWEQIRTLIHESYRLIAPKRVYAKISVTSSSAVIKKKLAKKKLARTTTAQPR